MSREISALLRKEFTLELRNRHATAGILLYVISTVFLCYLSFGGFIADRTWNTLLWIILLFASANAVSRTFVSESPYRMLYYRTMASAQSVILAKLIYNIFMMGLLSALTLLIYILFNGAPDIYNTAAFVTGLMLGSTGFASVMTLISAIGSRSGGQTGMMAVLAFPVMLPLLITAVKSTAITLMGTGAPAAGKYLVILGALNVLSAGMAYLLFPYLWRE